MEGSAWVRTSVVLCAFTVAFITLTVGSYTQKSATVDEPQHLTAGYAALRLHDYRIDPEHPPFLRMWAALPLLAMPDVRIRYEPPLVEHGRRMGIQSSLPLRTQRRRPFVVSRPIHDGRARDPAGNPGLQLGQRTLRILDGSNNPRALLSRTKHTRPFESCDYRPRRGVFQFRYRLFPLAHDATPHLRQRRWCRGVFRARPDLQILRAAPRTDRAGVAGRARPSRESLALPVCQGNRPSFTARENTCVAGARGDSGPDLLRGGVGRLWLPVRTDYSQP